MYIDLEKTLEMIRNVIHRVDLSDYEKMGKAYDHSLRLKSQILGVKYDLEEFGLAERMPIVRPKSISRNNSKEIVSLVIPESLPSTKEMTRVVEQHWVRMIGEAIDQEALTGIPYFEKAHVLIRITAPRGSRNHQVWDTSNRAINVIINNLKGIFFDDDNFEHMSFSVVADWSEIGMTEVRICAQEDLKKCEIFC